MFKTHRTYDLSTGVKNNAIAVFNDQKTIRVVYHKTTVVTAKTLKNGKMKVLLNSGGWSTLSTAIVMTRALIQIPSFENARVKKMKDGLVFTQGILEIPFICNTIEVR